MGGGAVLGDENGLYSHYKYMYRVGYCSALNQNQLLQLELDSQKEIVSQTDQDLVILSSKHTFVKTNGLSISQFD